MSALVQIKGGVPIHVNGATGVGTVKVWTWSPGSGAGGGGRTGALWFENTGTGAIVLSFSQADADADIGVSVAAGVERLLPVECCAFWTKSVANQTFQAVAFLHRG